LVFSGYSAEIRDGDTFFRRFGKEKESNGDASSLGEVFKLFEGGLGRALLPSFQPGEALLQGFKLKSCAPSSPYKLFRAYIHLFQGGILPQPRKGGKELNRENIHPLWRTDGRILLSADLSIHRTNTYIWFEK